MTIADVMHTEDQITYGKGNPIERTIAKDRLDYR